MAGDESFLFAMSLPQGFPWQMNWQLEDVLLSYDGFRACRVIFLGMQLQFIRQNQRFGF